MAIFDLRGVFRGGSNNGVSAPIGANFQGDLLVSQGMPRYAEIARKGNGYATMATSAVAGLVIRPTTVAALEIYNNMQSVSLIVDRLFSHQLVSGAFGYWGIYAMVTVPKAAPADAALAVNSLVGKPATTKHVLTAAGTTVVDNGWFPYGPFGTVTTVTTPGSIQEALIEGRLIVPPLCSLCIHVVATATGNTFTSGAAWYEEPIVLG